MRHVLVDEEEEEGEGQHDGYGERHLLSRRRRQDERQQRHGGHDHGGRDEDDDEVSRLTAQMEAEVDGWKRHAGVGRQDLLPL